MMNKQNILRVLLLCFVWSNISPQGIVRQEAETKVPLSMAFHEFGWNALRSITYNYGANFIGAGLGMWAFIETGLDWKYRNFAYEQTRLSTGCLTALYVGYVMPVITPITLYVTGRFIKDEKLQLVGLALIQSWLLTSIIQMPIKMITGRALPGVITVLDHTREYRVDDFSGKFNWFNMNFIAGTPSGHTANSFSAAAVIAELYNENLPLKIAVYSYAALVGLGVSFSVHWASEVFAGALIGYAIGKTVGRSFRRSWVDGERWSFYATPSSVGVSVNL
ncbi:MAG: phosphatase PAP2 family protein [Treponema sp.]|jgi:membrane-associated phospholipid phosphatase|nr:phosphatase PAP2 family protein [Treponema sp.]